jgi:hypothetical protein
MQHLWQLFTSKQVGCLCQLQVQAVQRRFSSDCNHVDVQLCTAGTTDVQLCTAAAGGATGNILRPHALPGQPGQGGRQQVPFHGRQQQMMMMMMMMMSTTVA